MLPERAKEDRREKGKILTHKMKTTISASLYGHTK